MSNKTICVDNVLFNKVSKRLQEDRSLHETKENLAQAFGFRNLNALQQFFNTPLKEDSCFDVRNNLIHVQNHLAHFIGLNREQKKRIFSILLANEPKLMIDDLLLDFLELFIRLSECEKKTVGSKFLIQFKDIHIFFSWLNDDKKPINKPMNLSSELLNEVRKYTELIAYKTGYPYNAQYDRICEMHTQIHASVLYLLETFETLQKTNPLLFSIDWMQWVDDRQNIHNKEQLRERYLNNEPEHWCASIDAWFYLWLENKDTYDIPLVAFQKRIIFHEKIDDTWLKYPLFLHIVVAKLKNGTIDKIYLSDLIFDYANTVNPVKEERLRSNITHFLKNLNTTQKLSLALEHA